MKNHRVAYFAAILTFASAAAIRANDFGADGDSTPKTSQDGGRAPGVGAWWTKSSLSYHPIPDRFLYHAEGTISYLNAAGNTSGETFDGRGTFEVRRWRFTSRFFTQLSKKDITYGFGGGTVNYTENTLREEVEYDLTKSTMLIAGIEDYRNTLVFMDKRLNTYGGIGADLVKNEKHQLNLIGAIGHADFTFDRAAMLRVNPAGVAQLQTTSPTGGGSLGMQAWRWVIAPRLTFTESATYMQYFESVLGHRWTIDMAGEIPITKHFSISPTYRVKEETNTYVKVLRVQPQDRTLMLGVKISI